MEKRKWQEQQKLRIVLEDLSAQIEISKLCTKYQNQTLKYMTPTEFFKNYFTEQNLALCETFSMDGTETQTAFEEELGGTVSWWSK